MTAQEIATDSCLGADQSGLQDAHEPLTATEARSAQERLEGLDAPELGSMINEFRQCRAVSSIGRRSSNIDVLVMHTPEGLEDATLEVADGTRAGFDFYLPLTGTLYQCNDYLRFVAWHAGDWPTNLRSVGIEQGDFAANSGDFPREHYDRLAQLVAALVSETNIPVRRATRIGEPGIIAHADVTPVVRTDPGPNFNWDLLLELVNNHLQEPDTSAPTEQPAAAPTLAQLQADNPNIGQQLLDWRQMRIGQGADPGDYAVFRQHVIDIGAPDPGEQEFIGFRD